VISGFQSVAIEPSADRRSNRILPC